MLVWHDVSVCVLPVCACDHLPRCDSDKDPFRITGAAISSNDFKGATMLLAVYFISFLLFCHQTGQCI